MATLDISRDRLNEAANFLREIVQEQNPEADLSPGTAMNDLVIKSFAIMYAYLQQEVEKIRSLQSLSEILAVQLEDLDSVEAVDALMSNWFLTRRSGIKVTGTVAIRFTRTESSLNIPEGHRFYLEGVNIFRAITDNTFEPTAYKQVRAGDAFLYEIQVAVESDDEGSSFTSSSTSGTLFDADNPATFTFDPLSPFAVNALQVGDFLGGENIETNEEFIGRGFDAITKRDLSTFKSIVAVLLEQFSVIQQIQVIGYGDAEMQRDRLELVDRCLVVAEALDIDVEEDVTADMKLYLKFNESMGKNYPLESTGNWLFNQIHFIEGVAEQDSFTGIKDHWVEAHLGNGLRLTANRMVRILSSDQAIQNYPLKNLVTGNFTISLWAKGQAANTVFGAAQARVIHTNSVVGSDGVVTIAIDKDNYVYFTISTPTATQTISSINNLTGSANKLKTLAEGGFSYITATYQGDDMHLFIDGELQDSLRMEGKWIRLGDFIIGGSSNPDSLLSFDGIVDNVIYRNVGYNDLQVRNIYKIQQGGSQTAVGVLIGDQEQLEDIPGLQFEEHFHVGGKVDIYCKTPMHFFKPLPDLVVTQEPSNDPDVVTASVYLPAEPVYRLYFKHPDTPDVPVPMYGIKGEFLLEDDVTFPPEGKLLSYDIKIENPLFIHTNRQKFKLTISVNDPAFVLDADFFKSSFLYDTVTSFPSVETYVEARENRIVCGDLLVKASLPIYVTVEIGYALQGGIIAIDESAATQRLINHIHSIKPGEVLEVSDLVAILYAEFGVGKVGLPIEIFGRMYLPDYQNFEFSSENALEIPTTFPNTIELHPVLKEVVTSRTVRYVAPIENILVYKL
jgi:hypothetical protein